MFDLMATAFQADVTRVFTFMMMRDVTGRSFPHIGVSDPHHALSHEANGRGNDPTKPVNFAKVNTHFVSMFAKFVEKLRQTPDGDGSLLDNSMLLFGSGMGNANDHTHHPLPTVVLGGGGGRMKALGQHQAQPGGSMADLLLALAQKAGAPLERFGVSEQAAGHLTGEMRMRRAADRPRPLGALRPGPLGRAQRRSSTPCAPATRKPYVR